MIETIFLVPAIACVLFLVVGNYGRQRSMKILPFVSLIFIGLIGGINLLASVLVMVIPFFLAKEISIKWDLSVNTNILIAIITFFLIKDYFGLTTYMVTDTNLSSLFALVSSLGLSFVIFRVIEYQTVGLSKDEVEGLRGFLNRLHRYIGFCLAFPSFTSGPILRWKNFSQDYSKNEVIFQNENDLKQVLSRLVNGLLKIAVLSQPLLLVVLAANNELRIRSDHGVLDDRQLFFTASMAIFYLHFLYINFSAFSDIMISSGRLIGLRLPENFKHPFSTSNFLDFFNHWHLSVSEWFRDMVFTPIAKQMIVGGIRSNTFCSAVSFTVTFGLLGLWHGRTWPFLLCGALLGSGALIAQIYRDLFRKKIAALVSRNLLFFQCYRLWLRGLTYYYISLAILGLWLNTVSLKEFWQSFLTLEFLLVSFLVVTGYSVVIAVVEWFMSKLVVSITFFRNMWLSEKLAVIGFKAALAIVIWNVWSLDNTSSFVYEGF